MSVPGHLVLGETHFFFSPIFPNLRLIRCRENKLILCSSEVLPACGTVLFKEPHQSQVCANPRKARDQRVERGIKRFRLPLNPFF